MPDPKYVIPPASTGSMALPKIPGNTKGMLIPGSSPGSSIWVPGDEDEAKPPAAPMPAAGAGAAASPMYAGPRGRGGEPLQGGRAAPMSEMDRMGRGHGPPPSMDGPHKVGRSANDPQRTAERLARQARASGNVDLQMQLMGRADGQEARREGMEFSRERDANRFDQQKEMFGMEQGARAQRDQWQADQQNQMWDKNQAAAKERDATQWNQQMTMWGLQQGAEATRHERDRNEQAQDEQQRREHGLKPVKVEGTQTPFFQDSRGSIFAGSAPAPTGPVPEGMVPRSAVRNGVEYGAPVPGKPARPPQVKEFKNDATGVSEYRQWDADRNGWTKVKFIDEDGDGIDDRQQKGGAAGGGGAAKPSGFLDL